MNTYIHNLWKSPHDVVANVLDCDVALSEFELQSYYYGPFRAFFFFL